MSSVQNRWSILVWAVCPIFFAVAGCGGSARVVPVKGILTYKGSPVPKAHLDFVPESGRPSWGVTDSEGRFELEYDPQTKGAVMGKHKVFAKMGPGWQANPADPPKISRELLECFDKYSPVNSKFEVEITGATPNLTLAWD